MTVRIDVEFTHPLGADSRVDFRLAVGDLVKAERVYFGRSGFNAVIMGEAMSPRRVAAKLREYGLEPRSVVSSLGDDHADDADEPVEEGEVPRERYKAIGRGG